MTVLITADLHFSENPRDAYRFGFFDKARALIEKRKVTHLIILGDITEVKDHHGAWLVNTIANEMSMLAGWCPISILRGNHDGLDPTLPFYTFLRHIDGIRWYSFPTEVDIKGLGRCLMLPHSSDYLRDWAPVDTKGDFDYIFAHNTFKGATGQHRELDGIPTSIFNDDASVYSGDVHVPHKVGPVTYVGSPYLVDYGDDFRPRMLLIKKNGDVVSIAVTGPQKRLLELDGSLDFDNAKLTGSGDIRAGDMLKVRVSLTGEQYAKWPEIKRKIVEWGSGQYQLDQIIPVTDKATRKNKTGRIRRASKTDDKILADYAASRSIDERTLKVGKKFL